MGKPITVISAATPRSLTLHDATLPTGRAMRTVMSTPDNPDIKHLLPPGFVPKPMRMCNGTAGGGRLLTAAEAAANMTL